MLDMGSSNQKAINYKMKQSEEDQNVCACLLSVGLCRWALVYCRLGFVDGLYLFSWAEMIRQKLWAIYFQLNMKAAVIWIQKLICQI